MQRRSRARLQIVQRKFNAWEHMLCQLRYRLQNIHRCASHVCCHRKESVPLTKVMCPLCSAGGQTGLFTCEVGGKWSTAVSKEGLNVSCVPVVCPNTFVAPHATNCSRTLYSSQKKCRPSCEVGYIEAATIKSYTCSLTGSWVGGKVSCKQGIGCQGAPCGSHATCTPTDGPGGHKTGHNCTCKGEWAGGACQTAPCVNHNDCGQHGSCTTKGNSHICTCAHGWIGDQCDDNSTGCERAPCGVHGEACTAKGDTHTCTCKGEHRIELHCSSAHPYWYGCPLTTKLPCAQLGEWSGDQDCMTPPCATHDDCGKHGKCVGGSHPKHECHCAKGWSGDKCDHHAPEPEPVPEPEPEPGSGSGFGLGYGFW